jgi:hypothetical protein
MGRSYGVTVTLFDASSLPPTSVKPVNVAAFETWTVTSQDESSQSAMALLSCDVPSTIVDHPMVSPVGAVSTMVAWFVAGRPVIVSEGLGGVPLVTVTVAAGDWYTVPSNATFEYS